MDSITTTHVGMLPYKHSLSTKAITANVLPNLHSASLISLGQLCDDNCDVNLNKTSIRVDKNNKTILRGVRNYTDGLWDIHIPTNIQNKRQSLAVIIQKNKSNKDLINFYHAACFSPTVATFYKAIKKGNFQSWPGLTPELVLKHLQPSIATHYGHLNQERQNLQSTRNSTDLDSFPEPELPNDPTNQMMATIVPYHMTYKAFSNLPGKFPHTSSRGAQYFLVIYHYDANVILVQTIKIEVQMKLKMRT